MIEAMSKEISDVVLKSNGMTVAFSDNSVVEVVYEWDNKSRKFEVIGATKEEKLLIEEYFIASNSYDDIEDISGLDGEEDGGSSSDIGDLSDLTTSNKSSIVDSINELDAKSNAVQSQIDGLEDDLGNLNLLGTADRSSLVNSINEVLSIANSAAGSVYTHVQSAPASPWTVNHNLGYRPAVSVFSVGGKEVIVEIIHASVNQTLIYFDSPMPGSATFS